MKLTVRRPVEVEIVGVLIEVPVRYDEEDIPNDFPLRRGDMWTAAVDIDTGKVHDWPPGRTGNLHMKVVDEGSYTLMAADGTTVAKIEQDYVPNSLIPGSYGDYIELDIDENGIITNWPKPDRLDVSDFFSDGDLDA